MSQFGGKTAVLHGIEDVRLQNYQKPTAGVGQVLVKVASVGICGSDLS
jgi:threonine dehydrogenase-like Zn-dependent dehydrogenase